MTRRNYVVIWHGMPKDQEYYCVRCMDARRLARALAFKHGHAEILRVHMPGRDIYFDRDLDGKVKAVEM